MLKNQKRYRWVAVLCIAIYSLSLMIPVNSFAEGGEEFKKILPKQQLWYFNEPQKAAVDDEGNLYVVEKKDHNNRVLKITPNGDTIIIAEDDEEKFSSIAGVATDNEGYIYVSDTGISKIHIFDSNGNYFNEYGDITSPRDIKVKDNKVYYKKWSTINVFDKDNASQVTSFGSDVINGDKISGFDVFKSESQTCIYVSAYKQNRDTYSNNNVYKFVLNEEGEYVYEQTYDVSDGNQENYTNGVVVDSQGYIYVLIVRKDNVTFPNKIIKLDSEGTQVDSWGCYGTGKGKFKKPSGLAIDNNDNIYVVDGDNMACIQKFDTDGNYITFWGKASDDDGIFSNPKEVVCDNEGNIYVVDSGNNRIQKFDSSGNYLLSWGSEGNVEGQFNYPTGISIDGTGDIYVADTGNRRIQKFDSSGTYLDSFGIGDGQFDKPYGVAVDNEGNIYVADLYNYKMQKFNSSGEYVLSWGSRGSGNGQFDNHHGVAIDNEGNVYVADTWNNRIQKFDSSGNHLLSFGSEGNDEGQFNSPYGLAIDNEGNIYVADTNNNRIQKFNSGGTHLDSWGREGSGDGEFDEPSGVSVDDMGNVYVVDRSNSRIQYLDVTPPEVTFEPNGNIEYGSQYDVSVKVEDNPIGVGLPDECNFKYIWSTKEILESEAVEWDTAKTFDPKLLMSIPTEADLSTCEYYLHVKVWDKNGNETVAVSQPYNIDKDEPEATFTPMGGVSGRKDYRVNIAVADNAVAVDTTKLKYQWVNEGNEPSDDSWNLWPEQNQEAVNILASETGANENGSYYLYVHTCDVLGNEGIVKSGKFVIDEEAGSEAVTIVSTGIPNNSAGYNQEYDIDIQTNITGSTTLYYQWTNSPAKPTTSSSEWTLKTGDIHYGQDVNGDKYLHVKAVIDGITYYETQQFLFDNVAPTIGFTPMTSSQPKQTVSTEVYVEDNIKGQPIKLYVQWKAKDELSDDKNQWNDTLVWSEDTDRIYQETVTKNSGEGEYILFTKAVDSAVNEAVYHSDTFIVDAVAPTGNIEIASSTIKKNVTVSMDVYDVTSAVDDIEYSYSINNGTSWSQQWIPVNEGLEIPLQGFEAEQNVSVQVKFRDEAGNISQPISDSRIVEFHPDGVIAWVEYNTTDLTPNSVTAYLKWNGGEIEILSDGGSEHEFQENGMFYFEIKDKKTGTVQKVKAQVYNIDDKVELEDPQITYSTTSKINGSVVATLRPLEEVTILNNDGSWHKKEDGSWEKEFTENGEFNLQLQDEVENNISVHVQVDNIDKDPPILDYIKSNTETTGEPVEVVLTANEEIIVLNNLGLTKKVFTENGNFTFKVRDEAGNSAEITVIVDNIDKVPPEVSVEYSTTDWTDEPVKATVRSDEDITVLNNKGSSQYVFNTNGKFYFKVADKAGNWTIAEASVQNIDKNAPVITFSGEDHAVFVQNSEYTLNDYTAQDDVMGDITDLVQIDSKNFDITTLGSYEVIYRVEDTAGNIAQQERKITVISPDELRIFINGVDTLKTDKVILCEPQIRLGIFNPMGDIKTKWKHRKLLQNEMKAGGNIVSTQQFKVDKVGWHTVYIQDQERNTRLLHVYVASTEE
ncbi:MAG: DUF5011 domain-containing protein [Firmicutes bacterium]|nr:DUF5011 domain-containing protein [Bacillota bacterium]